MAEQSEFARRAAELGGALIRLQSLQQQVVVLSRRIQDAIVFGDHPELVELDDELDIMYRGQL